MINNAFKVVGQDNETIEKNFPDGETPFYTQTMFPQHTQGAIDLLKAGKLTAIVSEEHGGIIGYVLEKEADHLTTALNLLVIERKDI